MLINVNLKGEHFCFRQTSWLLLFDGLEENKVEMER